MNGDMFGGGDGRSLDVLQGDPSRVRDLSVGFGSLRTIRAEASATGPDGRRRRCSSTDGQIKGTVTNSSDRTLESRRRSSSARPPSKLEGHRGRARRSTSTSR